MSGRGHAEGYGKLLSSNMGGGYRDICLISLYCYVSCFTQFFAFMLYLIRCLKQKCGQLSVATVMLHKFSGIKH